MHLAFCKDRCSREWRRDDSTLRGKWEFKRQKSKRRERVLLRLPKGLVGAGAGETRESSLLVGF